MQFMVTIKVLDTICGKEGDRELREALGTQLPKLMATGKVRDAGFFGGMRASYFIMDIDASEDLYALLGPEIYGYCDVRAHPIIPLETGTALFQQWAEEGR